MNDATTANIFSVFPHAKTRLSKQEHAKEGMLLTAKKQILLNRNSHMVFISIQQSR